MPSPAPEAGSESSGQALERYISAQLAAIHLEIPHDDVEYIARFVEEPDMDRLDKLEGVRGMLEGVMEGDLPGEGLDIAMDRIIDEWKQLRSMSRPSSPESSPSPSPKARSILSSLTSEELAAVQRQALLRQYGYVEGGPEMEEDFSQPMREGMTADEKKAQEERRRMIVEAVRLDGRKKKVRKQKEVDLLAPNINRDKMLFKAQAEREAQKKTANERRERDRLALEKQRNDAAKAKADKQKKAAKQERRG